METMMTVLTTKATVMTKILDIRFVNNTKEMISFIDQVDDKWEALGHKYYADIEHLLK